jgi:hypothetical protein
LIGGPHLPSKPEVLQETKAAKAIQRAAVYRKHSDGEKAQGGWREVPCWKSRGHGRRSTGGRGGSSGVGMRIKSRMERRSEIKSKSKIKNKCRIRGAMGEVYVLRG